MALFSTTLKVSVIARSESCECRVSVTAYADSEETRANQRRCSPKHAKVVSFLQAEAETKARKAVAKT